MLVMVYAVIFWLGWVLVRTQETSSAKGVKYQISWLMLVFVIVGPVGGSGAVARYCSLLSLYVFVFVGPGAGVLLVFVLVVVVIMAAVLLAEMVMACTRADSR